jgi:hypothetical protein
MKISKLLTLTVACLLGATFYSQAQEVTLPEIEVVAVNYKYLNSVSEGTKSIPVLRLQEEVANFDLKNSEFYEDHYGTYFISFYIPEGAILAAYDKNGNILRTVEKFKNVSVPMEVAQAVASEYPKWKISKDVYLVNFHDKKDTRKNYKLVLEKGKKRIRVRTDEKGNFM